MTNLQKRMRNILCGNVILVGFEVPIRKRKKNVMVSTMEPTSKDKAEELVLIHEMYGRGLEAGIEFTPQAIWTIGTLRSDSLIQTMDTMLLLLKDAGMKDFQLKILEKEMIKMFKLSSAKGGYQ